MGTFAPKQSSTKQRAGSTLKPLRNRADAPEASPGPSGIYPSRHEFSRIPVLPSGPAKIQPKLMVNTPGDKFEREADIAAGQAMRMPRPTRQGQEPIPLQTTHGENVRGETEAPSSVHEVLASPGRPLDATAKASFETRFGYDFGGVRIHSDEAAAESSRAIGAKAYTTGRDIVFGAGQYAPATEGGRRVIAHELAHVVQQGAARPGAGGVLQRLPEGMTGDDADLVAEREYGGSGAPKAQTCGSPAWCPPAFCTPYRSAKLAEYYRAKNGGLLMTGISAFVDSRVVPLWQEYLDGGSDPKNLTSDFGADFTASPTTKKKTVFLQDELKKSLTAKPPVLAPSSKASIDIKTLISGPIAELDDPASTNQMNFNIPKDIPGNLAGGIGKDQLACKAGAKPSPFNDERHASGTVALERKLGTDVTVTPLIAYLVKDTIDLCPGDCGSMLEQFATIPFSQFEATGISGDVPFTVEFPAPSLGSFTVPAAAAAAPPPPPASPTPPSKAAPPAKPAPPAAAKKGAGSP